MHTCTDDIHVCSRMHTQTYTETLTHTHIHLLGVLKTIVLGAANKSTCCSFRGPRLRSQYLHGYSQPSIPTIPGDPVPTFGLSQAVVCMQCSCTHGGKTHTQIKIISVKSKTTQNLLSLGRQRISSNGTGPWNNSKGSCWLQGTCQTTKVHFCFL